MWLRHHFQGQQVKGQLAWGGGIMWRPPAQLDSKHPSISITWYQPNQWVYLILSLSLSLSLSVLTSIYQVNLSLLVFIEVKDDGGGGDNWTTGAISHAKLQSNHHHQQTNIQFLQAVSPSCHPTNSVKALKGKISHSMDLLTPSSTGVFQLCLWPLIAPGYLEGGLPCLSSALWCQYPKWVYLIAMNKCNVPEHNTQITETSGRQSKMRSISETNFTNVFNSVVWTYTVNIAGLCPMQLLSIVKYKYKALLHKFLQPLFA